MGADLILSPEVYSAYVSVDVDFCHGDAIEFLDGSFINGLMNDGMP
jgi:hypothetical protein